MSWRRSLKYLVLSTPKNLVVDESEVGINMPLGWLLRLPKDIVAEMSKVGIDVPFDLVLGTSRIVAEMKWIFICCCADVDTSKAPGAGEVGINMALGGCFSSPRHHGRELKQASICRCT
jgi:hypothetical protein